MKENGAVDFSIRDMYNMLTMNKLVPFTKFAKKSDKIPPLSKTSIVMSEKGIPLGFVFGRDSFIALLEHIDEQFEKKVKDPKEAFDNPAGKLIDLIEERLPLNPSFVRDLKAALNETKKPDWIPFSEVVRSLHV